MTEVLLVRQIVPFCTWSNKHCSLPVEPLFKPTKSFLLIKPIRHTTRSEKDLCLVGFQQPNGIIALLAVGKLMLLVNDGEGS